MRYAAVFVFVTSPLANVLDTMLALDSTGRSVQASYRSCNWCFCKWCRMEVEHSFRILHQRSTSNTPVTIHRHWTIHGIRINRTQWQSRCVEARGRSITV